MLWIKRCSQARAIHETTFEMMAPQRVPKSATVAVQLPPKRESRLETLHREM